MKLFQGKLGQKPLREHFKYVDVVDAQMHRLFHLEVCDEYNF